MRILVITHEFPPIGGGGANACYHLTKEFRRKGHSVTIVTANYQGLPFCEDAEGVRVIRVASRRANREHCSFMEMLSYLIKAWPVVERCVRKEKYDVCQIFFGIPSGPIGYLLKKKYQIPYVIRFGGGDIPGFQSRFNIVYKLIAPLIRLIWKNADVLIANSEGLRKLAYSFYHKQEVKIITNGVDIDYYSPKHRQSEEINILFASRLIERKGLQFLLPRIRQIIEQSECVVRLTIVGDGPYREVLEEMVIQEEISQYVSFEGHKDKDEIVEYYQKADIFVLPSKKEGMPNVVLEAMASGLPIVMTPCEGSTELVQDNGYVVSIDFFAEAVINLCRDQNLRKTMGERSRELVIDNFRWEQKAVAYLEIFYDL